MAFLVTFIFHLFSEMLAHEASYLSFKHSISYNNLSLFSIEEGGTDDKVLAF